MNTVQIDFTLSLLLSTNKKKVYGGTLPCNYLVDKISETKQYFKNLTNGEKRGFIINTDTSDQPGQHWIAICLERGQNGTIGQYFDSFGLQPLHYEIITFLTHTCNEVSYNACQLQQTNSITCGAYCVLFIALRCHPASTVTMEQFISFFSCQRSDINDFSVLRLMRKFTNGGK